MLLKYLKERENIKLMLLPRFYFTFVCLLFAFLSFGSEAQAGLYGFNHYNPYTLEERILNLSEVPVRLQNYRADMRNNLLMLIRYAKQQKKDFKIIVHEGQDLLTKSLWEYAHEGYNRARKKAQAEDDYFLFHHKFIDTEPERGTQAYDYLHSIDAIVINNLYCGSGYVNPIAKNHHLDMLAIEQCPNEESLNQAKINAIADKKSIYAFINSDTAFQSIGDYDDINDSSKNIYQINEAQNILILNDDSRYSSQEELTDDLSKTNYDIIIIKPLFDYTQRFSADNLRKLHFKKNGSKRLLIAEFNVAEANPKEYYWLNEWHIGHPQWLVRRSLSSEDGVITKYWDIEWRKIISRYFRDILNEGFDGVFLTGIETYKYFEQQNPLE